MDVHVNMCVHVCVHACMRVCVFCSISAYLSLCLSPLILNKNIYMDLQAMKTSQNIT